MKLKDSPVFAQASALFLQIRPGNEKGGNIHQDKDDNGHNANSSKYVSHDPVFSKQLRFCPLRKAGISIMFVVCALLCATELFAQASCTPGYTSVAPDPASVAAATASAPDGSVICLQSTQGLPNNWSDWNGSLTMGVDLSGGGTKALEIRGAGAIPSTCPGASTLTGGCGSAGQTVIYANNSNAIFGWVSNTSTHSITIDNIKFVTDASSVVPNAGILTGPLGGVANSQPVIIHHNDFVWIGDTGGSGRCFGFGIKMGSNSAVIYRNHFEASPVLACGSTNTNTIAIQVEVGANTAASWSSASTDGTRDTGNTNVYVEQNYFKDFSVALDFADAGRVVWRFNEMHNSSTATHGYDSSNVSPRSDEYYNNTNFCDDVFFLPGGAYFSLRGGTGRIFNNVFPAFNPSFCGSNPSAAPARFLQIAATSCILNAGWPGAYNGGVSHTTYPISMQDGWGWISGSNQTVGASTAQNRPGLAGYPTDGYQQALEPIYLMHNTNTTGNTTTAIDTNVPGGCRAMAYSNQTKASGMTLVVPLSAAAGMPAGAPVPYANVGQTIVAVSADNVGGTTPTITSSPAAGTLCSGGSFTALNSQTNGTLRLTAWTCNVAVDGPFTVTFTYDSSTSARAGTVIVMHGLCTAIDGNCASTNPIDKNPAVATVNASPYTANATGTLSNSNEIAIGYYALATPSSDNIQPGSSDLLPVSCDPAGCAHGSLLFSGLDGTTGGSDVSVMTTFRVVNSTSSLTNIQATDSTANPNGLAGVVTFLVDGSTSNLQMGSTPLDNQPSDFVKFDREIYDDIPANGGTFNGTTGTGFGVASSIPNGAGGACTNGTGYWATDLGSWNTTGSGGQGVLFVCGQHATSGHWPASLTTGNAFYIPATMPNPLNTVLGGNSMSFTQQPTSLQSGTTFSVVVNVTVNPPAADSITLTSSCGTLTGTTTVTSNGSTGVAAFSGLGMTGVCPSVTLTATNNTDMTISPITSNAFALTCAPTKVVFTSQPTGAALGASLGTVKVTEEDNSGNICSLASDTITLSKDAGATWGTLVSASNLAKAASSGVATWTDLSVTTTAGTGSIDATSPGLTSAVSNSITISGGGCTPDHLTFIAQPQNALLGQNVGTIQVAVKDSGGNTCNDTSTVTLAKHAGTCTGMTLNGTVSGSAVAGVFLTSNVNLTVATGACQLDATDGALTGATSNLFNITVPASGAGGRAGMVLRRGRH